MSSVQQHIIEACSVSYGFTTANSGKKKKKKQSSHIWELPSLSAVKSNLSEVTEANFYSCSQNRKKKSKKKKINFFSGAGGNFTDDITSKMRCPAVTASISGPYRVER